MLSMAGLGSALSERLRVEKNSLLRRRSTSYSHVALHACPGVDNQPEAYFWRLTNGKVSKTFHVEDTKWWLLELIPIELK